MATIIVNGISVNAPVGGRLIEYIPTEHRPDLPCGGAGRCGKCRVKATGELSAPTAEEKIHLTPEELKGGIRLACMTNILGDCTVFTYKSDSAEIKIDGVMPEFEVKPNYDKLGAVIDLGTTTIAALLYEKDKIIARSSCENSEKIYGADVITRIGKAIDGLGSEIASAVQNDMSNLLMEMVIKSNRSINDIEEVVITGNTAMLYLLTNTDPTCLSAAPFIAKELFGKNVTGLNLPCKNADVYLPPCISAFVGADITTAIMAAEIHKSEKTQLLVDIGTNGEMALAINNKLLCCSTAAGPAFEGAGITMGMMGKPGAIDKVLTDGEKITVHTIGEKPAVGICGSGIIDGVAAAMDLGILDENGFLETDDEWQDESCFNLTDNIVITQKDIRMVQLAKSAIHAGALTLIESGKIKEEDVDEFKIAGGFGSFINKENSAKIGLIPKKLLGKTTVLGNAALSGGAMLLLNPDLRDEAKKLAEQAETIDLSTSPTFMNLYVESMMFE